MFLTMLFRAGGDGADDPHERRRGQHDEEFPEGADDEQGQTGQAHGRGPERDQGAEAVRLGVLLFIQAALHQGRGD